LTYLVLDGNPLRELVLPEPLAITSLAGTVSSVTSNGAAVYTYPLDVSLVAPQRTVTGAFTFTLTGPPAAYSIFGSTDLVAWSTMGTLANTLGSAVFSDSSASNAAQKFYYAVAP
jgi:hypothetical protein